MLDTSGMLDLGKFFYWIGTYGLLLSIFFTIKKKIKGTVPERLNFVWGITIGIVIISAIILTIVGSVILSGISIPIHPAPEIPSHLF